VRRNKLSINSASIWVSLQRSNKTLGSKEAVNILIKRKIFRYQKGNFVARN
jgi:hypothetical protein